ncbi:MAG TPA: YHS domain-containing protein [Planctomycetota bacterium]|nr:YHS domain-containing protein [Planctomycetota bacterium]
MKRAIILSVALAALAACSTNHRLLAPDHEAQHLVSSEKPSHIKRGTDPVCGTAMDNAHEFWHTSYHGNLYYFDSEECKKQFEDNPDLFSAEVR